MRIRKSIQGEKQQSVATVRLVRAGLNENQKIENNLVVVTREPYFI
jgi:hypothetical protein